MRRGLLARGDEHIEAEVAQSLGQLAGACRRTRECLSSARALIHPVTGTILVFAAELSLNRDYPAEAGRADGQGPMIAKVEAGPF